MKTHLHGSMGYAKTPELRCRVGNLGLPERRNWHTSNRVEEEEGAQEYPCGNADESRTRIVGELDLRKEERNVFEDGISNIDGCDMKKFCTMSFIEKTIAVLGDKWWPQTAKEEGNKISKPCYQYVSYGGTY